MEYMVNPELESKLDDFVEYLNKKYNKVRIKGWDQLKTVNDRFSLNKYDELCGDGFHYLRFKIKDNYYDHSVVMQFMCDYDNYDNNYPMYTSSLYLDYNTNVLINDILNTKPQIEAYNNDYVEEYKNKLSLYNKLKSITDKFN